MRAQIMDAHRLDPKHNPEHYKQLLQHSVRSVSGQRDATGKLVETWLPKPADAVLMKDETSGALEYVRLVRLDAQGAGSDLPDGLQPVTSSMETKGQTATRPAVVAVVQLLDWMRGNAVDVDAIRNRCDGQPWQIERRTDVGIDRNSFAAENGRLFQTEGLDFGATRIEHGGRPNGWRDEHFMMLARATAGIDEGTVTFGGERRLSWRQAQTGDALPQPADWANTLSKGFALSLITPALFDDGWKSGLANESRVPGITGLRVKLRAAVLDRWQGISGWDLREQRPRAARKAVASGATYWFEVLDGDATQLSQLWLIALSDDDQDRRDGFGIALPRPWNPQHSGVRSA